MSFREPIWRRHEGEHETTGRTKHRRSAAKAGPGCQENISGFPEARSVSHLNPCVKPVNLCRARHAHTFHNGKDESQNPWRPTRLTATGSSCNDWPIAASFRICEPATASTERTARSTVQSGLLTSPKTTAISVPLAKLSTTAAEGAATPLGRRSGNGKP
jgi:hypothetical protein